MDSEVLFWSHGEAFNRFFHVLTFLLTITPAKNKHVWQHAYIYLCNINIQPLLSFCFCPTLSWSSCHQRLHSTSNNTLVEGSTLYMAPKPTESMHKRWNTHQQQGWRDWTCLHVLCHPFARHLSSGQACWGGPPHSAWQVHLALSSPSNDNHLQATNQNLSIRKNRWHECSTVQR